MRKRIFCFWFGSEMSPNRIESLRSIRENSECEVVLIEENNLLDFIIPEFPIHPGFNFLSSTHKSDYLRSYFMYYYGGGYTDIKRCNFSWVPYFDQLNSSKKQFIGYPEKRPKDIGYFPAQSKFNSLAGMCQYIFKPNTEIAKSWLDSTNEKMNKIYSTLLIAPGTYHPRAITGGVQGEKNIFSDSIYPLKWTELLGEIFHRIQFENLGEFLLDFPYPIVGNHR